MHLKNEKVEKKLFYTFIAHDFSQLQFNTIRLPRPLLGLSSEACSGFS
jgi:hypothetical protein